MIVLQKIDPSEVLKSLDDMRKQIPFATAFGLTQLAKLGQGLIQKTMPEAFDRPTPYTVRGVRILVATPARLESQVFLQGAGTGAGSGGRTRFLVPEVEGGTRRPKGFEILLQAKFPELAGLQAVPAKGQKLDAYGNLPGSLYNLILSSLQAQRDALANTTDRSLTRRIRSGKAVNYFVGRPGRGTQPLGVWARAYTLIDAPSDGRVRSARSTTVTQAFGKRMGKKYIMTKITPVLLFVKPGNYKVRLAFYDLVEAMVMRQQEAVFRMALARAMETRK